MSDPQTTTPANAGYSMPAEWEPHAGCVMAWPSRAELWGDKLDDAKRDYGSVADAIAAFEPVVMVCNPGLADDVRSHTTGNVTPLEIPINDSWARDSGPAFVRNAAGEIAVVGFGFNAWGNRWHPHDDDAALSERLAAALNLPFFKAPFVLEGGSFFVDGEGTLITTEQCLLNPNRNPDLTREQIEQGLRDHLGVVKIVGLPWGHRLDTGPAGTDGHVDGVLQYVAPSQVVLEAVTDRDSPEYSRGQDNLDVLRVASDAVGRPFDVMILDPASTATVSYANHYLPNGGVIVPVGGNDADGPALDRLREIYPGRRVVGVPGETLAFGGGGPHCITQQIPAGVTLPT
ncbi:MAG: Agmatine deiminase [Ilumatobacteraceae bacterium]|nr:Agmatine deiminase [Ilumatobacteraceae bacterium]